jgi:AcrR family transcriptional regulator
MSQGIDESILRAAVEIAGDKGWHAVSLEAVAERSGVSRATLYRRGITLEAIASELSDTAAAGWKAAIWPSLTAAGTAAERLELALRASCAAIDAQAGILLGGPNPIVDRTSMPPITSEAGDVFVAPFVRLILDGAADGSLAPVVNPTATATAIFSVLAHGYLQLRGVDGADAESATDTLVALVLRGALPR